MRISVSWHTVTVQGGAARGVWLALLALAWGVAAQAQLPVERSYTWSDPGTASWTADTSRVELANPGGYLNLKFAEQSTPSAASCEARGSLGSAVTVSNISFRFLAAEMQPSSLRLCLHSRLSQNLWYLPLTVSSQGEWVGVSAPVTYARGWTMGPAKTEQLFVHDAQAVDWVGVYVRRAGSCAAQNYGIDDLTVQAATFDRDGDGIPDAWEDAAGLNADEATDALADPDGDGANNAAEYASDTNPRDASSVLRITQVKVANGAVCIEWVGGTNSCQYLQQSDSPSAPWQDVLTKSPPTPAVGTAALVAAPTGGVFRLRASRP